MGAACVYHILFIYSSIDGYVGCFHLWAIVTEAAMNVGVQIQPFPLTNLKKIIFKESGPRRGIMEGPKLVLGGGKTFA